MGHRVYQRIRMCDGCGEIPEDGSPMWEMCGEYLCEDCVDCADTTDEEDCSLITSEEK